MADFYNFMFSKPFNMFTSLIHLFFPPVCAGCESLLLQSENTICSHCRHAIPRTGQHLIPENEAFKKFYGKIAVEYASAFLYYHKKGIVQQLIHNLKYKGMAEIGSTIGHWYAAELKSIRMLQTVDAVIPVPLHPKKLKERGYNQVSDFGRAVSVDLGLDFNEKLLVRKVYSKTQTRKNLSGRAELNAKEIFDVVFLTSDHNKHFLLIDDVLTTGATLEACCRALLKIPGTRISVVCMAMSHS